MYWYLLHLKVTCAGNTKVIVYAVHVFDMYKTKKQTKTKILSIN